MTWHELERSALAQALTTAGPDAPTLCEGWQTRHLAAHVVLRQSAPFTAAGAVVPALAGRTERAIEALATESADPVRYARLVQKVAAGPPRWNPLSWAGDAADLLEFFVHTEDVRRGQEPRGQEPRGQEPRAQADPRDLAQAQLDALWRHLVRSAPLLYHAARVGVVLVVPGGPRRAVRRARRGAGTVVVRGEIPELVLHAFGRTGAARVNVLGDAVDVSALARSMDG